jgi:hypothetical protein
VYQTVYGRRPPAAIAEMLLKDTLPRKIGYKFFSMNLLGINLEILHFFKG